MLVSVKMILSPSMQELLKFDFLLRDYILHKDRDRVLLDDIYQVKNLLLTKEIEKRNSTLYML